MSTQTYIASGTVTELAVCNRARSAVLEHLDLIMVLTRNEPEQNAQITEIETLVNLRLVQLQGILTARQEGRIEQAQSMLVAVIGGTDGPDLQRKIKKLKEDELDLLSTRDTASYLQAQTTRWTVWLGVVLDGLLLLGVVWLIRDDLAARHQVALALQEANAQLEKQVQQRTTELVVANRDLAAKNLEREWSNLALEHQLRYNHNIVDSITDLVMVITKVANISRVNPAVQHLTGLDTTDLINQPLASIVQLGVPDPDTATQQHNPITQAMKEGRDLRDQFAFILGRNGQPAPVRFSLFPLRDQDKVIGGIVTLQIIPPGSGAKV